MEQKINIDNLELPTIDFKKIQREAFIDVKEDLPYPPVALSIGSTTLGENTYPIPFGTFGNFSCIVGASKSKKTFIKSLILASFIGGQSTRYAPDFTTHRKKDMFVFDFDCEQGKWHSQRVFKRVIDMVGQEYKNYKPFYLRKYDYKERLQFIEYMILESEYRNDVAFVNIDGYADLVNDVNDLASCNDLAQKLLKWTDVSKCHITGILHANYGSKKPTGHLGSAILKKSETVCNLVLNEQDPRLTDVSFPYTRSFNIDDFSFTIDNKGFPIII